MERNEPSGTDSLSLYDHVSPTGTDYPAGTYRVVGTGGDGVTLLRVGDADNRRVNTGDVVTIGDDDRDGFEMTANPDGNRPLGNAVASIPEAVYWSVRVFARQLAAHPIATALVLTLILAGYFGEGVLPFPEVVLDVSILLGSLGLAYVGSGRL